MQTLAAATIVTGAKAMGYDNLGLLSKKATLADLILLDMKNAHMTPSDRPGVKPDLLPHRAATYATDNGGW